ncbi:cellulase family glycosylhydrolase [Paenibacillaceae bacterium WGS1546]|uniref:cellulase family glycosylhydrolase n=1 Tax=Cohnella sp. WGS1546 TaxID=3366810 RepID=UPI00372D32BD
MRRAGKWLIAALMPLALSLPGVGFAAEATAEKNAMQAYVDAMQPGWNLGNTYDAVGEDETAWGNPRVTKELIGQIADQGFKSIRIPITYDQRMAEGPEYTIDADFLDRIEQTVQWSLDEGLYAMINIHHDSWIWLEAGMRQNHDESLDRFSAIWTQVADRFKDYSGKLMFESINEPRFQGTDEEKQKYLDELNAAFYRIVRESGGKNDVRPLVLPTLDTGSDPHKVDALYEFISALDDPNVISTVHYYGFWPFSVNVAGFTTFNEETKNDMITIFDRVHDKFTANGIPVIIGEFGLLGFDTDLNAIQEGEKLKFFEYMLHYAQEKQFTHMLWDNGQHFGRKSFEWSNPDLYQLMKTSWETRSSTADSDFIYLKQGEAIADVEKQLQLNGNRFASLKLDGKELAASQDYEIDGDALTIKASLLESLTQSGELGTNGTLTISFDKGMDWKLYIIVYETAELGDSIGTTRDFAIPVAYNGDKLATLEAVYEDGSFAGPHNWTSFKEFAYTFTPSYEDNELILKENFFKEVNDGIVHLTLHFWSGEALEYTIVKAGASVAGAERLASFKDVEGHWAKHSIAFLAALDVVQGQGDGKFDPEGDVTRAAFVEILVNALGLHDETAESSFRDVEAGAWYADAVASAEKLELVSGKGNGDFGVNDPITRQEAAVILHRAMKAIGVGAASDEASAEAFADQDSISDYAKDAVAQVQQAGILLGKAGGRFDPGGFVSRAETATVVQRLFDRAANRE